MTVHSLLISVVIPTYNSAQYITRAIDSVLAQEGCVYEVIVIDDGSTDNTRSLLQSYGDRIRYVYQKNQGVSAARNHGIQIAQGAYIAFLDADDLFLDGKLAAQLHRFETALPQNPNLGIVHSGWVRVNAEADPLMEVCPWETTPDLNLETWLKYKPVLPSAMMFRKDWLTNVNGFDTRLSAAEDVDLVVRLALEGCTACWLPHITTAYRQHSNSAMGRGIDQAKALSKIMEMVFNHPNISKDIQLLEYQIRYGTLVWLAWYLYQTGFPRDMVHYLTESRQYSPHLHTGQMINWVESFCEFSQAWGETLDVNGLVALPEWQTLIQELLIPSQ